MTAARFCSECGARLKVKRTSILPLRSFCPECSPGLQRIRLLLIAVPVLCTVIGFAVGHYTGAREPFHFIGTPVDITSNRIAPSGGSNGDHLSGSGATLTQPEQFVISPSVAEATCGARTKSGRPCRRKVKGSGHCWQHRDGLTTTK